jgi:hypothetical protein
MDNCQYCWDDKESIEALLRVVSATQKFMNSYDQDETWEALEEITASLEALPEHLRGE